MKARRQNSHIRMLFKHNGRSEQYTGIPAVVTDMIIIFPKLPVIMTFSSCMHQESMVHVITEFPSYTDRQRV